MPIWVRWVLAIVVAAGLTVGLVIAVDRAGPETATSESQAEAESNRIADIAITEDEAPHAATLVVGSSPVAALERVIASDVRGRISSGRLTGPLQGVVCKANGKSNRSNAPYQCTVRSAGITYSFVGVINRQGRRLAWCKVDPPSVANVEPEVQISARCR